MTNKCKVGIIDDLFIEDIFRLVNKDTRINYMPHRQHKNIKVALTHSTICVSVFADLSGAEEINVYDTALNDINSISGALVSAVNDGCALICLSIGTTNHMFFKTIQDSLMMAVGKGAVVICAKSNTKELTFPASSKYSIGVKLSDSKTLTNGKYNWVENPFDGIDIITSLPHIGAISSYEKLYGCKINESNSLACQYIAALIYREMNQEPSIQFTLTEILRRKSTHVIKQATELANDVGSECPIVSFHNGNISTIRAYAGHLCDKGYNVAIAGYDIEHNLEALEFSLLLLNDSYTDEEKLAHVYRLCKPDILVYLALDICGISIADVIVSSEISSENSRDILYIKTDDFEKNVLLYVDKTINFLTKGGDPCAIQSS